MSDEFDRLPPPAYPPGSPLRRAAFSGDDETAPAPYVPVGTPYDGESEVSKPGSAGTGPFEPERVAQILSALALRLRESGPAELLDPPPTTDFEAVLRGYIAGYFAAR